MDNSSTQGGSRAAVGGSSGNALSQSTTNKTNGGGGSPDVYLSAPPGSGMQGQAQRPLSTSGGTSTSTQHSSYLQQGQSHGHGVPSSSGALHQGQGSAGNSFDDIALRLGGPGFVGAYSPEQRRLRIEKFIEKRGRRVWTKKVKYDVRKNFADSRLRVKVTRLVCDVHRFHKNSFTLHTISRVVS